VTTGCPPGRPGQAGGGPEAGWRGPLRHRRRRRRRPRPGGPGDGSARLPSTSARLPSTSGISRSPGGWPRKSGWRSSSTSSIGSRSTRGSASRRGSPSASGPLAGTSPSSASLIVPEGLTRISRMRRSRVTRRGEPGERWNPRDFRAFATASMLTLRLGDDSTRPRTTETSSSWGAVVCEASAGGRGAWAGRGGWALTGRGGWLRGRLLPLPVRPAGGVADAECRTPSRGSAGRRSWPEAGGGLPGPRPRRRRRRRDPSALAIAGRLSGSATGPSPSSFRRR
jgi:hypothetical protein